MACSRCKWDEADPEIGRMVVKKEWLLRMVVKKERQETFNGFIRRNCTLRRLEKAPAQKIRDLYSKIQGGNGQTAEFISMHPHQCNVDIKF